METENQTNQTTAVASSNPIANNKDRSALWLLAAVVIGFMLPVCACAVFFFGTFSMLGSLGGPAMGSSLDSQLGSGPAVAVVRVEGAIFHTDDKDALLSGVGSAQVIDDLRTAEADEDVKAIILRVDSPGGTVTGSAQIYEVLHDEITKPVVVSMAGLAASGGYYISTPADYIIARPDTLTGSLGVIFTLYNVEELAAEWGIEVTNITSGRNKTIGSPWQELTPEQQEIFASLVDESYEEFVRIIVEGRGLSEERVRELADGRIYSGQQAAANGLVDELGNFKTAVSKAAALGGISGEPRIIEYEHLPSLSQLLGGVSSRLNQNETERILNTIYELTAPTLEYRYQGQ